MKRFFLLPVLLLVLLAACEKEDSEPEPAIPYSNDNLELKEKLQGTWTNYLKTEKFYNLNGEVVHEDSAVVNVLHVFEGNKMDISYADKGEVIASLMYSLPDTSATDNKFIVFLKSGQVVDYYQITSISDSVMVWDMVVDWAGYVDENGDTITSRKGVYTYDFKRK